MTPEQEDALIDRMVSEIWRLPMDNEHFSRMRAALSIAKPIIRDEALEEAAGVADGAFDRFKDPNCYSWNRAATYVGRTIRALKSKGQNP